MITTAQIRIEAGDDMTMLQKYDKELRTMILTPEGTVIGNRDFGINFDIVDMQPLQAVNYLAMELEKKIPVFIPEIQVKKVDWSIDPLIGKTVFSIRIGKA